MSIPAKKIGLISLGCPKNRVDSEVMLGQLVKKGFEITRSEKEAEILVVNTCGFITPATAESIRTILEMAELKKDGACKKLVVTGCLVERYRNEICSMIPEVDAVLGVNELEDIARICETESSATTQKSNPRHCLYLYGDETPRLLSTPHYLAYLKIAEGCNHTCSFCTIPRIRGEYRSRPPESIVREAQNLARQGVKEINIISQDTTRYGKDLGMTHGLAELMEKLVQVDGIEWFRVHYTYPNSLDPAYIDIMQREAKICRYLDMPLQHVSERVLKKMKRGGNRRVLEDLLNRVRLKVPDIALRTTMIVGFPGETDKDFEELMKFCLETQFDHLGVFSYFDEEGTASSTLKPKIPEALKEERKELLMTQQARISFAKNRQRVGKTMRVLVEGISQESEHILQGRTAWQAPEIDGCVLLTDSRIVELQAGKFYNVKITRALEHDLIGRVISSSFS